MGNQKADALQGALSLLILKTLGRGPLHGYAIANLIQARSEEILRVEEGSLYPALHRMEQDGLIASDWGQTESNRRARFYRLTAAGQAQLEAALEQYRRVQHGIQLVLNQA